MPQVPSLRPVRLANGVEQRMFISLAKNCESRAISFLGGIRKPETAHSRLNLFPWDVVKPIFHPSQASLRIF